MSAFTPSPSRIVVHRSAPPPSHRLLLPQVKLLDVSVPFYGLRQYSIILVSLRREIDSGAFPLLRCLTSRYTHLRWGRVCSATERNEIVAESSDADSSDVFESVTENQSPFLDTKSSTIDLNKNNSTLSANTSKRAPLTAREKLRAARVLSRYTESKPSKSQSGNKILDALRESDKGKKKAGLPEAPGDLFDDGKRGLPKSGLTFDFPGGSDLLIIAFSFVFISTVMFATTYIVWKVGAIHFNEY